MDATSPTSEAHLPCGTNANGMASVFSVWSDFMDAYGVWLAGISLVSFVAGLMLVPVFIARIPPDYFSHPHRHLLSADARHPLIRLLLAGLKNLLGAALAFAGLIMLFTPGQGLLTLLVGLMLMNYPGKFALERWFIARPHILPAINWLRTRHGHPPLMPPLKKHGSAPPADP